MYVLWHPSSPGSRILSRGGILRRLGINRSEFATLTEAIRGTTYFYPITDHAPSGPGIIDLTRK